jgi:hypothetical protein
LTVKASEEIVPTALSEAIDGQPLPPQPLPLFSSQYTGRRSAKKSDHSVETPFTFAEGQAQLKMYERALANVGIQDVTSVVQPVR